MIFELIMATAEELRQSLDLPEEAVVTDFSNDPRAFPRAPNTLYTVHSLVTQNAAPEQDYWDFRIDIGVTMSMLTPQIPWDRPQTAFNTAEANPLRTLVIAAYKLQAARWKIVERANGMKHTNIGGIVEAPFVSTLPASLQPRGNDWWKLEGEDSGRPVGVTGTIRFGGARWLSDMGDSPGIEPSEGTDIVTTAGT